MTPAFIISGYGGSVSGFSVIGGECSFDVSNSTDLNMSDIRCLGVETAVRGSNVKGLSAERIEHDAAHVSTSEKPEVVGCKSIAYFVRMAARGYV